MNHANVDTHETEKFNELASQWWNPNGPMRMLHKINPIRLDYIKKRSHLSNKKVLDVGCGAGLLTEAIAKAKAKVTGIDMSQDLIKQAQEHAIKNNLDIHYHYQSIENLAESTQKKDEFDVITCMELLEHVPDPESVIKSIGKLLKRDGHLFVSTLNRNLKAYLLAIVGAEYIMGMLPKNTHHYEAFIRPSELAKSALPFGLFVNHIAGITYHPLSNTFKLSQDVSVNYILHFIKH